MSDDLLLSEIYRWIGKAEDDNTSDALYWLITEAFERFAPDAEARQLERDSTTGAGDPSQHEGAREGPPAARSADDPRSVRRPAMTLRESPNA